MNRANDSTYSHRLSDIVDEPKKMLLPIEGYERLPLVTLEETLEPLVDLLPNIQPYVSIARCNSESALNGLTVDQAAAIMLYTMDSSSDTKPLYCVLNSILRSKQPDRHEHLKPWFLYLKLFISALPHVPSYRGTVYRGVKLDLSEHYPDGKKFVWWGFASCTKSLNVLQTEIDFGEQGIGTVFIIECFSGKEIQKYSYYPKEDEVLLLAARQFVVVSRLNPAPNLWIIHIRETEPPFPFLKTDKSNSLALEVLSEDHIRYLSCSEATTASAETSTDGLIYSVKVDQATMTDEESTSDGNSRAEPFLLNSDTSAPVTLVNSSTFNIPSQCQGTTSTLPSTPNTNRFFGANSMKISTSEKVIRYPAEKITVAAAQLFGEDLRHNKVVEILYFLRNGLQDDGLRYILQGLVHRSNLTLFVVDNEITDVGATYVAEFISREPQVLRLLSLDNNSITAQGFRAIIQAIPRNTKDGLRSLSIKKNSLINDECVDDIIHFVQENRSLKSLDIERCNLSADGKERLRQVMTKNIGFFLQF